MTQVLIVDDQEQNLYMLQVLLQGQGYEVRSARNGIEALDIARRQAPDLIITDILMPGMDGFSLCREWMADERLKHVPLVFYTATYTDPQDEALASGLGAARFIVKPTEPDAFVEILRQVLEAHAAQRLAPPVGPSQAADVYYQQYNQTLIRKLEDKMAQLEEANRALELDIAERQQAEEALTLRSEELARSNRDLEQFAYVATHDLQEPLRMVSSYLQLLERRYKGKLDSDADTFIGYAVEGASRMKHLIDDLLAYSRVSTRGREPVPTDCNVVLDHVLANLQIAIQDSQASVTREPLPTVQGDSVQLEQLFQNLVANAIKFHGDQPPEVRIAAKREGREWVFSVRDNGIGIDPKYFERIFVIFQRLHTREDYPGTGIGLAVAKRIVERHGGRMWVESEPGQGATFFFALPAQGE